VNGNGHAWAGDGLKKGLGSFIQRKMRELRVPDSETGELRDATPAEKAALGTRIHDDVVRMSISRVVRAATTELLESGINPNLVARRVAAWLPATSRGDAPDEIMDFSKISNGKESIFDGVSQDGAFNIIRRSVESLAQKVKIPPAHEIDLDAENAFTQQRSINDIVTKAVEEKYRVLRNELVNKNKAEGAAAAAVVNTDGDWETKFGQIPGITAPDSQGRTAVTVGQQLKYLGDYENSIKSDPSLLGGDKWEWVATAKRVIDDTVAKTPALPRSVQAQFEKLYNGLVPGINFKAGSAQEMLYVIDWYDAHRQNSLIDEGEYRPTRLEEIIAPGAAGHNWLEAAVVAVAEKKYPQWSAHKPIERRSHSPHAYIETDLQTQLTAIIDGILDGTMVHAFGRDRVAAVFSRLVREMISVKKGVSA